MKIVVCIPARYDSTRFPGKVLAKETGKYLIQHTYEQACKASLPERAIIAADDERIVAAAKTFGAECVLTRVDHQSGTDRIAEAVADVDADIVINVQGDEPDIAPAHIDELAQLLLDSPDVPMATLATSLRQAEQVADPNIVKAIVDTKGKAIYFSRCPIPYDRGNAGIGRADQYLRHIGIYAYRKDFLLKLTTLPQTPLEKLEKLEQLRVIENGYAIGVGIVEDTSEGIDTPEQYAAFVKRHEEAKRCLVSQIEGVVDKWFTRIVDGLKAYGPPKTAVDEIIMASVSVIENYLTSGCLLAGHRRVLPTKALLRPVGEFTAKLRYCLAGRTEEETYERIQRWRKSSWQDYRKYLETVRTACQGSDCSHIEHRILEADTTLSEFPDLNGFPQVRQVLEAGFPHDPAIPPGIYAQHLVATHIDVMTLAQTVSEESGTKEYAGDLLEDNSRIELDLLSQAYLYVETIAKHYGWDYQETLSEYTTMTQSDDGDTKN